MAPPKLKFQIKGLSMWIIQKTQYRMSSGIRFGKTEPLQIRWYGASETLKLNL